MDPDSGESIGPIKLWLGNIDKKITPFWFENLNLQELHFTPDSAWLLVLNSEGYSLLPKTIDGGPPQFLGNFIKSFGFSSDGKLLAFLQWKDSDIFAETNEVILMHRTGEIETLLRETGEIDTLIFNESGSAFYLVLYQSYTTNNAIYYYSLDKKELQQITNESDTKFHGELSITINESTLAYEVENEDNTFTVHLLDLKTGEEIYTDQGERPMWR
jgi:hypothetical protein